MGTEDLFVFNREEEEAILKRAGVRDLIELMRCKNCLYLLEREGKYFCKDTNTTVTLESHCPIWTENINQQEELKEIYNDIKEVLKRFVDTKEENYEIITLWIMGTWIHDSFPTYTYLFTTAMKGSGKTRLLKLIKELSWKGEMLASLSEAVLFRTTGTLCIDEFEGIGNKDKNALRELLNTAYKKGGKVMRMRKKKTLDGEQQIVEEFNTFRPIVMANISGMEEVLNDRCINIVLDKSDNPSITKKIENFQNDPEIIKIKKKLELNELKCRLVKCMLYPEMYIEWNRYIDTLHTHTTLDTQPTQTYTNINFFEKIYKTGIDGRNLELAFPLLILAEELGILDKIIEIIKKIVEKKKEIDVLEGRDVMVIDFVTKQTSKEFYKIQELTTMFRQFINYEVDEEGRNWLTNTWMGKALARLNLIIERRRMSGGVEVMLNIEKAQEKIKMFK